MKLTGNKLVKMPRWKPFICQTFGHSFEMIGKPRSVDFHMEYTRQCRRCSLFQILQEGLGSVFLSKEWKP